MSLPIEGDDRLATSFLLASFEEFYSDLLRVQRAVVLDPWGIAAKAGSDVDRAELRLAAARTVQQRLQALLEKQAAEAGQRRGDHGAGMYREAMYVMTALADEVFLNLEWEGRSAWAANLLETRIFGTQVAGERIFQRIEQFLRERDTTHREIEVIYLLALSLGFEGRYRGGSSEEPARLRRALYTLVYPRQPSVLNGERALFPQAYMHTLQRREPIRLPTIGRWSAALVAVLIVYLTVAHVAWVDVTLDIRRINADIAELSN